MNKSELEKVFIDLKNEIYLKHDTPGKAYEEMGETLPVILFRFEIITGYVGPGKNDFCEEGVFFSGDDLTELGQGIFEGGLEKGLSLTEDHEEQGCIQGLITLADRYYKKAELLALKIETEQEKDQLYQVAEFMRHLSQDAPKNFLEKVELLWLLQLGEVLSNTGKVMSMEILDKILKASAEQEELTEDAKRIIDSFFQKWKFVFGKRA
ncbi:MAG: pyruvate formate lyase family protein [Tissierellia bacterium]|nr:pyruvate formate lyase family protein [Tissierellia bacterium]